MEKEADEYCEKIFILLAMSNQKIRFNELHRNLTKYNAKMSKPTLIQHLNHLLKHEIIQRDEEDKQKVSYGLNWKRLKQLQKAKKINQTALNLIKNEKRFKSKSLDQQTIFTTAMITIGELFYLKLMTLNILEPENKLQNYHSYTFIRKLYNIYVTWLLDSCKDSKENSQKILHFIERNIKTLNETFLEIFPEDTQQQQQTQK
jgi:DNA-binding HxlR family transcriptional regulator